MIHFVSDRLRLSSTVLYVATVHFIVDGYGNERVRLSLAGTIDRSQFGVDWNMPLPSGEPALPDVVTLAGELTFVKAQG